MISWGWWRDFFALGDDWVRPGGGVHRRDVLLTVVTVALSLLVVELMRGVGSLEGVDMPRWQQWLWTVLPALPLLVRRRWPLAVAIVGSVIFWAVGTYAMPLGGLLSTQIAYFLVVLGGVAWARSRREMVMVVGGIVGAMFLWLVWGFAVGNASLDYIRDPTVEGWHIPTPFAAVGLAFVINLFYFGGAVVGGQVAWRTARQRARLEEQAATIAEQADELRDRAVVEERLRIARELHDVVAHHVSGMGVQAAAARRVLDKAPDQAAVALGEIESSSRSAVTQMRGLLGTLRAVEGEAEPDAPQPGLRDIPALVAERRQLGLDVTEEIVEEAPGAADRLSAPVGHSLYRTAQEALTNVTRHSTARSARVAVRVGAEHAEVEVTDDGRPKGSSAGSGMGHLGIRERAASHDGTVEIGPRALGGYRVRMRIPLREKETR